MEYKIKSTKNNEFPNDGEYVLIYLEDRPWGDNNDIGDKRFWKVAKFVKGISVIEREQLEKLNDPRAKKIYPADEHANNEVPYYWDEFGMGSYFGQEVTYWIPLLSKDELMECVSKLL